MKREYPQGPIPAVSGVVFDDGGRVLLVRRARFPAKDKWSLPGGVVHLGEELSEALKREIKEECGLVVEPGPLLAVTSRIIRDAEKRIQYHYVLLDYLCYWVSGRLEASSDARDARWLRMDEAEQMDLTEGVLDVVRRGEARIDSDGSKPGRRP